MKPSSSLIQQEKLSRKRRGWRREFGGEERRERIETEVSKKRVTISAEISFCSGYSIWAQLVLCIIFFIFLTAGKAVVNKWNKTNLFKDPLYGFRFLPCTDIIYFLIVSRYLFSSSLILISFIMSSPQQSSLWI